MVAVVVNVLGVVDPFISTVSHLQIIKNAKTLNFHQLYITNH